MNKNEFITKVSKEAGESKVVVESVISALSTVIVQAAKDGESVRIAELGTFKPVERAARTARNPRTGEAIPVPAKTVLKFTRKESL